jgi:peroxiredoxin
MPTTMMKPTMSIRANTKRAALSQTRSSVVTVAPYVRVTGMSGSLQNRPPACARLARGLSRACAHLYAEAMALSSLMVPLGTPAPNFTLDDLSGTKVRLDDFAAAPALLVAFLCNHCPYVRHIEAELGRVVARYPNLAAVGICTNDSEAYPDDRPERLAGQARRASWTFPYLLDTEQTVGRAFGAACTPDFFLYDAPRRLAYRGAFDESTPGNGKPVTGASLSAAISHVLAGEPVPEPHRPSMGCSIKWRPSGFKVTLQVTRADAKPRSRPEGGT